MLNITATYTHVPTPACVRWVTPMAVTAPSPVGFAPIAVLSTAGAT